jgi:MtN3 and saliva related transmembrane protein
MSKIEFLGVAAGCFTTGAFAPQALKILRTRRVDDISMAMYVSFVTGVVLWLVYGIAIQSVSLMLANAVTLLLAGGVLVLKIRLGGNKTT